MFRDEVKATFLEFPGRKLVARVAADIVKERQRQTRQVHNAERSYRQSIKPSRKNAVLSAQVFQKENLHAIASLPSAIVNPITECRERVIEQRAKVRKVSKKLNATPKRVAAAKIKAVRLQVQKETRAAKKQAAIDKAAAEEW